MVAYDFVQYNAVMSPIHDRNPRASTAFLVIAVCFLAGQQLASCTGAPLPREQGTDEAASSAASGNSLAMPTESRRAAAKSVRFRPAVALKPALPSAIGAVAPDLGARLNAADIPALSASFRDAYVDAVFRELGMEGSLGGDRVTGWLPGHPTAYTQNWRTSVVTPNSWGLPALVLAVRPVRGERVFIVKGAILDAYGRGEGIGGANGVVGYGAPLSDEFPYEGGLAQRFERGLIVTGAEGTRRFLPEEAPSVSSSPGEDVGSLTSAPPAPLVADGVRADFRSAWIAAIDRGLPPLRADGPVRQVSVPPAPVAAEVQDAPSAKSSDEFTVDAFSETEKTIPAEPVRVDSALIQTYGDSSWALVLPVGEGLGGRVRLLLPPFLDLLLLEGTWEKAFAAYGVPLSDPFFRDNKSAQRFSAGWAEEN